MLTSSDFPRIITNNNIAIYYKGKHSTISFESANYSKLLDAFREERWDDVPALLSPEASIGPLSNGKLRVDNGQVYLTTDDGCEFAVTPSLNKNIMLHIEQKLNLASLINFALNLQNNTSSRSIEQLFDWIQNTNLTITDDGCFIAYKGIRKDFLDSRTGTFDNSPGKIVEMPRNQVDDDPRSTCSHGLHVATYGFASTWSDITVSVKVDPADVVAVPVDYNRSKMRVCKYKVLEKIEQPIESPVYESKLEDSDDECECGCHNYCCECD